MLKQKLICGIAALLCVACSTDTPQQQSTGEGYADVVVDTGDAGQPSDTDESGDVSVDSTTGPLEEVAAPPRGVLDDLKMLVAFDGTAGRRALI